MYILAYKPSNRNQFNHPSPSHPLSDKIFTIEGFTPLQVGCLLSVQYYYATMLPYLQMFQ